jgi:putative transposase
VLSRTAVRSLGSVCGRIIRRSPSGTEQEFTYLFVDGIAERLRPGAKREPVLVDWGFTVDGRRVLLHLMAGSKKDAEKVTAFFAHMKSAG